MRGVSVTRTSRHNQPGMILLTKLNAWFSTPDPYKKGCLRTREPYCYLVELSQLLSVFCLAPNNLLLPLPHMTYGNPCLPCKKLNHLPPQTRALESTALFKTPAPIIENFLGCGSTAMLLQVFCGSNM